MAEYPVTLRGPVVVIGAGGHAHPVVEMLDALGVEIAGLADRSLDVPTVLGHRVIVKIDDLASLSKRGINDVVVAVGNNEVRVRLADYARSVGLGLPTIVHPTALVSPSASLREGVQIMARAFVGPKAVLERLVLVNTAAIVEHECYVGSGSHIAPGSVLCGAVRVGMKCLVGAGSTVVPGCTIGDRTIVGAGGVVADNLGADLVVGGLPARPLVRRP